MNPPRKRVSPSGCPLAKGSITYCTRHFTLRVLQSFLYGGWIVKTVETESLLVLCWREHAGIYGSHWSGQSWSLIQIITSLKKKKISADWLDRHLKSKLFSPILVSEPLTQSSPSLLPDAMNTEWKAVHHSRIFCSLTIQARRIKHIIPGPRKCLKPHSLWIKRKKEKMHLLFFLSPTPRTLHQVKQEVCYNTVCPELPCRWER